MCNTTCPPGFVQCPPITCPRPPIWEIGSFCPSAAATADKTRAYQLLYHKVCCLSDQLISSKMPYCISPHITNPICTNFNRTTSRRVSRIQGILWRWKDDTDALQWPAFDFYLVLTFCGGWVPFKKSAAERLRLMKTASINRQLILTRRKFTRYVIFFHVPEIINKTKKFNTSSLVSCSNGWSKLDQVSRYFVWELKKVKVMSKLNDIAVPYSKNDQKENNHFVPEYDFKHCQNLT